jgi:hypothetical protein
MSKNKERLESFQQRLLLVALFLVPMLLVNPFTIFGVQTSNATPAVVNSTSVASNNTITVESEGIVTFNPQTVPEIVRVGDRFGITATIFNYSPYTVIIPDGGCSPTGLSATFDKNVEVMPSGIQFPVCHEDTLMPAKTMPLTAGSLSEIYTARSPGETNATLHLIYKIQNEDNSTSSLRQFNHEFQFVIVPNT